MVTEINFISYELAKKIVASVMEEEHAYEPDRRVLTVYDIHGKELCWYDAEEVLAELDPAIQGNDDKKVAAVERILHQIPEWAVDPALLDQLKTKSEA